MNQKRKTRSLVLFGAGASIEYGAPSTPALTKSIQDQILSDAWMKNSGGDKAFNEIRSALASYFHGGDDAVNFEQIYHCAHELIAMFPPGDRAVNEYRPVLIPFIERKQVADKRALRAMIGYMTEIIFKNVSQACETPTLSVKPLSQFLDHLRSQSILRCYTTNYDDFPLQAAPDLYTGFECNQSTEAVRFNGRSFYQNNDADCLYHLHGSVHMGFHHALDGSGEIGELYWFNDRASALKQATFLGSGLRQMDGSEVERSAIITGLDKLSRLQQRPLSYFYAALASDALAADIIYLIGSGLTDLHLNNWLGEARRQKRLPPIIMVDWWQNSFAEATAFDFDRKTIEMWHSLRMHVGYEPHKSTYYGDGWTIANDRTCAV